MIVAIAAHTITPTGMTMPIRNIFSLDAVTFSFLPNESFSVETEDFIYVCFVVNFSFVLMVSVVLSQHFDAVPTLVLLLKLIGDDAFAVVDGNILVVVCVFVVVDGNALLVDGNILVVVRVLAVVDGNFVVVGGLTRTEFHLREIDEVNLNSFS